MDKITTYRAFDGTTFDSESECLQYERKKIVDNNSKKAQEISEFMRSNKMVIYSFLSKVKSYCACFGEMGTCNGCFFADRNRNCAFGDIPEGIDIEAILNLIEENEDE